MGISFGAYNEWNMPSEECDECGIEMIRQVHMIRLAFCKDRDEYGDLYSIYFGLFGFGVCIIFDF